MRLGKQLGTRAVVTALIATLLVVMVAFAGVASYEGLLLVCQPAIAALLTALGAGVLALVIGGIGCWRMKRHRSSNQADASTGPEGLEATLDQLLDPAIKRNARRHPQGAALATLGIGVALGCSRSARRILRSLIQDLDQDRE